MNFLNNMKLRMKLTLSFLLIVVAMIFIGALGIIKIRELAQADTVLYANVTVPISELAELGDAFQRARVNLRGLILEKDKQKNVELIKTLDEKTEKFSASFEKTILTAGLREKFQNFRAAVADFQKLEVQVRDLALANRSQDALTAIDNAAGLAKNMDDAFDSMMSLKIEHAKKASMNNEIMAKSSASMMTYVIVATAILSIVIVYVLARSITGPLEQGVRMMLELKDGNLERRLKLNRKDEIGILTNSMDQVADSLESLVGESKMLVEAAADGKLDTRGNVSKFQGAYMRIVDGINKTLDAVVGPLNEAAEVLQAAAQKNMTLRIKGDYKGDLAKFKNNINSTLESMDEALTQVGEAVQQVTSGAEQISDASQSLSQGATEQASSLEEITSSMTQIGSQTKTNAENASQANGIAKTARDAAEKGNSEMKNMVDAMNDINASSQQIAKVNKVIDDIAFQTNLLALNAAVEAARAGRHGKGFAVVADEVRNLAGRSAKAAKETAEMIEASGKKVENGLGVAKKTSESFGEIVSSIVKVTDIVGEIAAASNEQAQGITQANQGLEQVDQVTQQNTANAEETASAAEELSGQATQLQELIQQFTVTEGTVKRISAPVESGMKTKEKTMRKIAAPVDSDVKAKGKSSPKGKWGSSKIDASNEEIISLDSKEFGKY